MPRLLPALSLFLLLCSPAPACQPEASDAPPTLHVVLARDASPLDLSSIRQPYTAIHAMPEGALASFVESFQERAPELAGVRHLVVHPGPIESAREFAAGLADPGWIVVDADGSLARALGLDPATAPRSIVLGRDGRELLRVEGHAPDAPPTFEAFASALAPAWRAPAVTHYNLPKHSTLVVDGYDVVSYIDARTAAKGAAKFESDFRGLTYRFANAANQRTFAADPERYLPTYGGWCASAMGDTGAKVEIDPTNFKVKDGRLFLFYKGWLSDALKDWNKREKEWEPAADRNWKKLTGESPIKPEPIPPK